MESALAITPRMAGIQRAIRAHFALWMLLAIVLLFATMRYGLLDVPLERDEGEYAYAGQLFWTGFLPIS